MNKVTLRLAHLYPDYLNLYGDRGNVLALKHRSVGRGLGFETVPVGLGEHFDPDDFDLFFIGGGQDSAQKVLIEDFLHDKGPQLKEAILTGLPGLAICGGYQLLGKGYKSSSGEWIEGLGVIDAVTEAGSYRFTGDLFCESPLLREKGLNPILIGFENHAGRTRLGPGVQPLGKVIKGMGNNGEDQSEGAVVHHLFATYMHGSLLPKNPDLTDTLIELAYYRRYPDGEKLPDLDKSWEERARRERLSKLKN